MRIQLDQKIKRARKKKLKQLLIGELCISDQTCLLPFWSRRCALCWFGPPREFICGKPASKPADSSAHGPGFKFPDLSGSSGTVFRILQIHENIIKLHQKNFLVANNSRDQWISNLSLQSFLGSRKFLLIFLCRKTSSAYPY